MKSYSDVIIIISGGSRICEKGGPGIQMHRARPEKVARGGGGGGGGNQTHFPLIFLFAVIYIKGYRLYHTDLRGENKREKKGGGKGRKKKIGRKRGAAADSALPPPPWIRH